MKWRMRKKSLFIFYLIWHVKKLIFLAWGPERGGAQKGTGSQRGPDQATGRGGGPEEGTWKQGQGTSQGDQSRGQPGKSE